MSYNRTALIGFTGFVGGNLARQHKFDCLYNSANIGKIGNEKFDTIICAAPSAVKWKANKEPETDLALIRKLISDLNSVNTTNFVHISTIDVYGSPADVNEETTIQSEGLHPYGKHRLLIEEFVKDRFKNHFIIRLPALFGEGLKKNLVYDLLNNNCLELTDADSEFQFYNIDRLWQDVSISMTHKVPLLNIVSEPICSREMAIRCFGKTFENKTGKIPVKYNVKSKYDQLYGGRNGYLYDKETIVRELRHYVELQR